MQNRSWKYHMAHEHKTRRKTDEKGNDKGSDMRFEGDDPQV